MNRDENSTSPTPDSIVDHYRSGYEKIRLDSGAGRLESERSRELLRRFLPKAPSVVLDVGGGPGGYACWLAKQGYTVHLIDIVPLHVDMARKASEDQPEHPLASVGLGDARSLDRSDASVDAVLLLGPLYHLTDCNDRLQSLREAFRVLRKGGVLLAVGISRFASTLDGLKSGYLADPAFANIAEQDLLDGQHRNPTKHPGYFTDAFFHHPDELRAEVQQAGFCQASVYGVEGPGWLLHDFDDWWDDEQRRSTLLRIARILETEPALIGISTHLMAVASKC